VRVRIYGIQVAGHRRRGKGQERWSYMSRRGMLWKQTVKQAHKGTCPPHLSPWSKETLVHNPNESEQSSLRTILWWWGTVLFCSAVKTLSEAVQETVDNLVRDVACVMLRERTRHLPRN
jgi:hypothetical protein